MERWHKLVCSQETTEVPAATNRLEGWFGRFKLRACNFVCLMAQGLA